MTGKRKRYSAEFKAKVAMEALRGELTASQLATKHGVTRRLSEIGGARPWRVWCRCFRARRKPRRASGRGAGEAARQDRSAGGGAGFLAKASGR